MEVIMHNDHSVLAPFARYPQRNPFADVESVDACGAPILREGATPVPCENEGYATVIDATGPMARMRVTTAEREVAAGRLVHVNGNTYRASNQHLDAEAQAMLERAAARRQAAAEKRQERYRAQRDEGLVSA
jgi:hypothetical protein